MKKKSFKFILLFLVVSTLFLTQTWRLCTRVVDGDTIILDEYERVCLIGVDTPETNLNAESIKQGYGFAYTRSPFRYLEGFRKQ